MLNRMLTVAAGAAIFAGLLSIATPARAQPQTIAAAPLKLAPTAKPKPARVAVTLHRPAIQRRASTSDGKSNDRNLIRGRDTVGLIALLPWWRVAPSEIERIKVKESLSQVLGVAQVWLGAPEPENA